MKVAVLALAALVAGCGGTPARSSDRVAPTSLATVTTRTLSETTPVSGTLGYAGGYTVLGGLSGKITALPAAGQVIRNGQALYRVDDAPVVLLYGSTPAYRALAEGVDREGRAGAQPRPGGPRLREPGGPRPVVRRVRLGHQAGRRAAAGAPWRAPDRRARARNGRLPADRRARHRRARRARRTGGRSRAERDLDRARGQRRPRRRPAVARSSRATGSASRCPTAAPRRAASPRSARWPRPARRRPSPCESL